MKRRVSSKSSAPHEAAGLTSPFTSVQELRALGVLSPLNFELAKMLMGLVAETKPEVELAVALASWAVQRGHVCADLAEIRARGFSDEEGVPLGNIVLPDLEPWLAELRASRLLQVAGESAEVQRPLVLVGHSRLYLARYALYEQRLIAALKERSAIVHNDVDGPSLKAQLQELFPAEEAAGQRRACVIAALRGLSVISGGPGTGKTYSVANLLLLLQDQARRRGGPLYRIQLLAPTGKAAQRLGEAIRQSLQHTPQAATEGIPLEASTLHRALGFQRSSPTRFRHNASNPLPADVVVVDEMSMVDLALMSKLIDAVAKGARLVLLGDKDQLASVEAGAILGDIYGGSPSDGYSTVMAQQVKTLTGDVLPVSKRAPNPGLHDCMVHLTHVHRFESGGPIAKLASAINAGNAKESFAVLNDPSGAVRFCEVPAGATLQEIFAELVVQKFAGLGSAKIEEKLHILSSFRFLCAHRRGSFGVEAVNEFVAQQLTAAGVIAAHSEWYEGRPILITANDYDLELFNGDVGVIGHSQVGGVVGEGSPLVAVFPNIGAISSSEASEPRRFAPGQLPPHETVFAMSVHKSQGSELGEVALVLPEHSSPVITRELIYTAVTRARSKVSIFGSKAVLSRAIETPVQRVSGLAEALWGTKS